MIYLFAFLLSSLLSSTCQPSGSAPKVGLLNNGGRPGKPSVDRSWSSLRGNHHARQLDWGEGWVDTSANPSVWNSIEEVWSNYRPLEENMNLISPNVTFTIDCLSSTWVEPPQSVSVMEKAAANSTACISYCQSLCLNSEFRPANARDIDLATDISPSRLRHCMRTPEMSTCWVPLGFHHSNLGFQYEPCHSGAGFVITPTPGYFDILRSPYITRSHLTLVHESGDCSEVNYLAAGVYSNTTATGSTTGDSVTQCGVINENNAMYRFPLIGSTDETKVFDITTWMIDAKAMNELFRETPNHTDFVDNIDLTGYADTSACNIYPMGPSDLNSDAFESLLWLHGRNPSCSLASTCSECLYRGCSWCDFTSANSTSNASAAISPQLGYLKSVLEEDPCGTEEDYCVANGGLRYTGADQVGQCGTGAEQGYEDYGHVDYRRVNSSYTPPPDGWPSSTKTTTMAPFRTFVITHSEEPDFDGTETATGVERDRLPPYKENQDFLKVVYELDVATAPIEIIP